MTDPGSPMERLAAETGSDVYLLSAPIDRALMPKLREQYARSRQRTNCMLILCTYGGDAHAAYLIARFLRRRYAKVTVVVVGYCKSAGTLLAIGAHELVMGDQGELGPLDVQRSKDDDLFKWGSGLDIFQAVNLIIDTSVRTFENHFLAIVTGGDGNITMRTAAEIATELTQGVIGPLASQIDPLRLGEEHRAVRLASEYGKRLGVSQHVLDQLIGGYFSHGFVIDLEEAASILPNVRELTPIESEAIDHLCEHTDSAYVPGSPIVACLTVRGENEDHGETQNEEPPAHVSPELVREAGRGDAENGGHPHTSPPTADGDALATA